MWKDKHHTYRKMHVCVCVCVCVCVFSCASPAAVPPGTVLFTVGCWCYEGKEEINEEEGNQEIDTKRVCERDKKSMVENH